MISSAYQMWSMSMSGVCAANSTTHLLKSCWRPSMEQGIACVCWKADEERPDANDGFCTRADQTSASLLVHLALPVDALVSPDSGNRALHLQRGNLRDRRTFALSKPGQPPYDDP